MRLVVPRYIEPRRDCNCSAARVRAPSDSGRRMQACSVARGAAAPRRAALNQHPPSLPPSLRVLEHPEPGCSDTMRAQAGWAKEMAARRPRTHSCAVSAVGRAAVSAASCLGSAGRWRVVPLFGRRASSRGACELAAHLTASRTMRSRSGRRSHGAARYFSAAESLRSTPLPEGSAAAVDLALVLKHIEPLRLRYLTVDQLRGVFDVLVHQEPRAEGEQQEGVAPRFGLAGTNALLRDLAVASTPAERASDLVEHGGVSAAAVLCALDRDGDGWVTWEDFNGVIGTAAEKVDSRVFTVAGSLMFNFTAQGAAMPTIPLIAREIGCSTADIGFITSASAISRLLCNLPCAWLAEKIGRRPLLICGPAIGAASITMFGMSSSYEELIGWNAVFGIGSATTAAASTLYLNDVSTPRNRSRTTAPTTITALLGVAITQLLGCILSPVQRPAWSV